MKHEDNRLLRLLLSGFNRAFPYVVGDLRFEDKMLDRLHKVGFVSPVPPPEGWLM